ncbi:MAG: hypothetical protein EOO15_22225 [Chitinophagaceae bacterium]|nr:MAG: hypothetical protein EOO15_22225 [Chitinophagaceae bacterium]
MDQDLKNTIDRFNTEMSAIDEMVHVLLKGHLLLEEALAQLIDQLVFHQKFLSEAKLTFAQKVHIARSMCLRKADAGAWGILLAVNGLRNDLAHRLNSPEREKRVEKVKNLFFKDASDNERIKDIMAMRDHEIVMSACAHCAGFLTAATSDLRSLREIIFTMDRTMNPGLPQFEL